MFFSHLTIAGIDFEIGSDVEIVNACPNNAYVDFVTEERPLVSDIDVRVSLLPEPKKGLARLERSFDASDMWSLFRDGETRYVVHTGYGIDAPMWAAEFGLDMSSIRIHCGEVLRGRLQDDKGAGLQGGVLRDEGIPTPERGQSKIISSPMRYPLDQILLIYALARRQGFLLHSAGVLFDGKLWLLSGKSRAGKSTASALLQGVDGIEVISDDRIVVRKVGNKIMGYGTPWPGDAKIAVNRCAPIAGVLFLDQSPVNQIDEISATNAFERLMPVVSVPWYEPELFPSVMDFCGVVAKSLPMYRLQFRPDQDAADMIGEMVKGEV